MAVRMIGVSVTDAAARIAERCPGPWSDLLSWAVLNALAREGPGIGILKPFIDFVMAVRRLPTEHAEQLETVVTGDGQRLGTYPILNEYLELIDFRKRMSGLRRQGGIPMTAVPIPPPSCATTPSTTYAAELDGARRPTTASARRAGACSPWAVVTYVLGGKAPTGRPIVAEVHRRPAARRDRGRDARDGPGAAAARRARARPRPGCREHLAAAISGDSTLLVQGTAGTGEEAIRYGWNYAQLLADGPVARRAGPEPGHARAWRPARSSASRS